MALMKGLALVAIVARATTDVLLGGE